MDKLKMCTENIANDNFAKLAELFPNAVSETVDENGEVIRAIDKDVLMQEINCKVVDGKEERYQFTWPDKKKAVLEANAPTTNTLRPCREESVDFDNTQNLYIEGDNLEVLKILRETYLGKVKMIYIDPPYNTGNDFVYEDDFAETTDEYLAKSGQYDDAGNRLVTNTENNGRFHTDWLNMIYPRLKIARDLLSDDGVIFISIGDDEESNLIKVADEILGEQNFISSICHKSRASVSNDRIISENHNHILFYAKNISIIFDNRALIGDDPDLTGFKYSDEKGEYKLTPVDGPGGAKKGNPHYSFLDIDGYWRYSYDTMKKKYEEGLIIKTQSNLQQKYYKFQAEKSRKTVTTWWDEGFLTSNATSELIELMGGKTFDNPKSVNMIVRLLKMITKFDNNALIIDFFSGSATTAHAVMKLNAEDGGHRKFIMVQLPEKCDEKSEAYKAGYKNICEIGKERIRRAGKKIKESLLDDGQEQREIAKNKRDNPDQQMFISNAHFIDSKEYKEENKKLADSLDIGFRVLKLDTTNMKDVYYNPDEVERNMFTDLTDNIKSDRTAEDLLFQVMLDRGVPLSSKIEKTTISGKQVFNVADGFLIACFDTNLTDDTIKAIAQKKPYYFVMRDSSAANDSVMTNFDQIFKTYSPDTDRKII